MYLNNYKFEILNVIYNGQGGICAFKKKILSTLSVRLKTAGGHWVRLSHIQVILV